MTVSEIITAVDNFAWGPVLIIFSLGCGLLFSIALKFPQIRLFKQMFLFSRMSCIAMQLAPMSPIFPQ